MEKNRYIDEFASFELENPDRVTGLYFPIANDAGMKSAVTPLLGGDAKTDQNTFILQPASEQNLHESRSTRNFWVYTENYGAWSVTGASAKQESERFCEERPEEVKMQAGALWHKLIRKNKAMGLTAETLSFCPVSDDAVELHKITIINNSDKAVCFKPYTAIPLYCRSADNIRDHRHVTSLLHRTKVTEYGVMIDPTLTFDERGHRLNTVLYGAYSCDEKGNAPKGAITSVAEFIGEGGTLTNPRSIGTDFPHTSGYKSNGEESIAALQFEDRVLKAGESCSYIITLCVDKQRNFDEKKYLSLQAFDSAFEENKKYWQGSMLSYVHTADESFDNWLKWVSVQPVLRRIYGCSFLPHHDYGRGGRGWRDLWQDCLALLLSEPQNVKDLLINNFAGVRADGTNATIIGEKPGEFIADRNNIVRVWMDHGVWSAITLKLYIDQTGDKEILLKPQTYFKDIQSFRGEGKDDLWSEEQGNQLKNAEGRAYPGSILEHLLVQNLSVFFRVGEHNIMRLDGADWNDGLDMAAKRGESVAFTCLYYKNLLDIADFIRLLSDKNAELEIAKELLVLLDSSDAECDYSSVEYKKSVLQSYCEAVCHNISGEKVTVSAKDLIADLTAKAEHLKQTVNQNEIISANGKKWFNSYYDNSGNKVEGIVNGKERMMLTGQVFAVMSGIADDEMIKSVTLAADEFLYSPEVGGYRLNTDFEEIKTDLGRLFGFAYGTKENGAVFSHMAVMYANALYTRGYVKEGYKVLNALYKSADNFEISRMYPGIPEYFDPKGRGLYNYLTGSASWFMMTVICEVFGIKGKAGLLTFEPKLLENQFDKNGIAAISAEFYGRKLDIEYVNKNRLDFGEYSVSEIRIGDKAAGFGNTLKKDEIPECSSTVTVILG